MRRSCAVALAALLWGCGDDLSAGGGGIETNNTIGLTVRDADGAPVASARVAARPSGWVPGDSTDSVRGRFLTTDSAGRVEVRLSAGNWTFEARKDGFAALATRMVSRDGSLGNLVVAPMARLSGRVALAPGEPSARVAVAGTDHSVRTDADGRWSLDSLPPGTLRVVVAGTSRAPDSIELAAGTRDSLPWTGAPALRALDSAGWILLDDFSRDRPSIRAAAPGAVWYMATDRVAGGGSVFRRADGGIDSAWSRFRVADGTSGRSSFQADFDIDSGAAVAGGPYMQVGMSFPVDDQCLDLGALDSLSVTLRTTGPVRLEFRSAIHDSLKDYTSFAGVDLQPEGTGWKTHRIPVARFVPKPDAAHPSIPWSRVAECVLELRLVVSTDLAMGLSDLRLHGVPLDRFLQGRPR